MTAPPRTVTVQDHAIAWRGTTYPCRLVTPCTADHAVPVLVLGGGLQDRHSWARLERHLADRHPLLIPDLPSAGPPGGGAVGPDGRRHPDLSWDDLTDAALRAPDHLGIERFATLGVSSGYPIAYRLAQDHPARVTHLMIFGAAPRPGARLTALIHEGLRREADSRQGHRDRHVDRHVDQAALQGPCAGRTARPRTLAAPASHREAAEQLVGLLTNPRAGRRVLMIRAAARVLLNQLTSSAQDPLVRYVRDRGHLLLDGLLPPGGIRRTPALVGVGEHDTITTVADNRAVAGTITDVTFAVMEDADHLLHMERDRDFADLIGRFLHQQPLTTPGTTALRL
ncbi:MULTISPECIES: alpha/beta hydrolase [unclassified Kitasatospora]|uniref:alpha/beta fold hydrolase n=1 Tax=unclassified Kitasatospora TaxID=2633591 RepID=UPI00340BC0CC